MTSAAPPHSPVPLLGLAHGSRKTETAGAIDALLAATARLAAEAPRPPDQDRTPGTAPAAGTDLPVAAAYLEDFAPPSPTVAVEGLDSAGLLPADRTAVVVPLLFTRAYHAKTDAPQAIAAAESATGTRLHTAEVLGLGTDMEDVVLAAMERDGVESAAPVALLVVGSSDADANAAVHRFTAALDARRDGSVTAVFATSTEPRAKQWIAEYADGRDGADAKDGADLVVVPLFVAPGLLLDGVARVAEDHGIRTTEPLGDLLAPVVLARYTAALTA
ncbi:sirohydrochlorin chelatase [Brevibacterium litoralis]|uniref:sirohydrochlorin chelatase n=1 Tax=Brevibacterium litoralis TaxID=3138935 RepID=UPI0032EBB16C